ncbi:MAG: carbamate kinase [Gammaproteobacteria bacterium]|nr:carbamate kinase [Gammaproteobacteria bacterium]
MLIVVALGGNALLERGQPMEAENQRKNVAKTAKALGELARDYQIVICHGNGPQVGLLALQNDAYKKVTPYPLDVLGAESQGMIGYMIQQELGNQLPNKSVVTLLTQVVVDQDDPAFGDPSKPIGPVYSKEEAEKLSRERGWKIAPDGKYFRRVVPSPQPQDIVELPTIRSLLAQGAITICGGGGGIPVIRKRDNTLEGIEAVIDKDNTASLIAEKLNADMLLILTDVSTVCENFGKPNERKIKKISPKVLAEMSFARGSMGPKITASSRFVRHTHEKAAIGNLFEVLDMLRGKAGTMITEEIDGIEYY